MPGPPLTLEHLIALNDEMAALARMGVPLELGLQDAGRNVPGRLSRVVAALQQKMAAGCDLATALAQVQPEVPRVYQSIVRAGLRTGQLAAALETVAESARRVHEVRQSMRLASFYPLLVLFLAYVVLVIFAVQWIPALVSFYEDSTLASLPLFRWLMAWSDTARWWAPLFPLLVVVPLAGWLYSSRRSSQHPLRSMRHAMQVATFAELLSVMVEREVPLHEALRLAADATGNHTLRTVAEGWAEQLERGERLDAAAATRGTIPAWVAWLLQHSRSQIALARGLRQAATAYRHDVARRARRFAHTFPILVTIAVGGTATLITAVLIIGPWFYVLFHLGAS